jgi:hypothetical protein
LLVRGISFPVGFWSIFLKTFLNGYPFIFFSNFWTKAVISLSVNCINIPQDYFEFIHFPWEEKLSNQMQSQNMMQHYENIGGKKVLGYRNLDSNILLFGSSHIKTINNVQNHNLLCIPGGGISQFLMALDVFKPTFAKMKIIVFMDLGNDFLDRDNKLIQNSHEIISSTGVIVNLIHEINKETKIITLDIIPRPSVDDEMLIQLSLVSRFTVPYNVNHSHIKIFTMFTSRLGRPRYLYQKMCLFKAPTYVHLNDAGSLKLNSLLDDLLICD